MYYCGATAILKSLSISTPIRRSSSSSSSLCKIICAIHLHGMTTTHDVLASHSTRTWLIPGVEWKYKIQIFQNNREWRAIKWRMFSLFLKVKIWFQNRRSKYKKIMKAAQAPGVGGGLPLGSGPNAGSHSPQHQQMHSGMYLYTGEKHTHTLLLFLNNHLFMHSANVRNRN